MGLGPGKPPRWFVAAFVVASFFGAGSARAQDSLDDLARRHFESGVAYLQESDYDNALKAFQKAYDLSKRPEILLNIATVNERKGDLASAVVALETYLKVAPDNGDRGTVEARLANLEKHIEDARSESQTPVSPSNGTSGPWAPPNAPGTDRREPESHTTSYVLLGIGGAALLGAGITGIVAKSKYDDAESSCAPSCSDDQVSSGRTLAITSTVLTGVGVVSASIGAVLLLTSGSSNERGNARTPARARRWDLGFSVTPSGGAASAGWRF